MYGQFTLETMLAVAFGSEVNLLKGEGSLLTEATAGLSEDLSESIMTWEELIHCKKVLCKNYHMYMSRSS